ncbi:DNA-protecting protein DprA [Leptolyngbya cf. ectocarpi LEGE 11479]|uniref:DNA-protecting protein DprA n=1 Tax=Leptolyngbya cf. ectocarpi LEGE 11479 TaxID=1828722 RepID=A0A928X0H4_LEPEC|nr:DNA-processing protein DprA [Leptolyngbya ectocarpi]MBE9066825.1 DNA-protecting protein DprA [Leptolyngbya cf. ectocarpi LEGE 11479]
MERAYWLAWSRVQDVGPVLIKRLHEQFGSLSLAWQADPADLLTVDGIGLVTADRIGALRSHLNPQQLLEQYETQYPHFWTPADADYPRLLWEIPDPPPILYYRGPLRPNDATTITVGMVGTRRPSPYGRRWTQRLSRYLSQRQFTIVSGMATGIDTYAHQGCLDSQGQTIAVLGTGVDVVYPRNNAQLYQRILETGLILSEYPDGTPPNRSNFPRRNRIIAGLSHATLVTEAPERSGALITAYLANDYGRHVYALPDGLDNPTARGCLALINLGAAMVLGEDHLVTDLLNSAVLHKNAEFEDRENPRNLALMPRETDTSQQNEPISDSELAPDTKVDAMLQPIFKMIPDVPISLDTLVQTTQLDTSALLSGLFQLEMAGVITQLPGGRYQRI